MLISFVLMNPWLFLCMYRIQPNAETRKKQLDAWRSLVLDYCRTQKVCVIDVREGDCLPVFNNTAISSKFNNIVINNDLRIKRFNIVVFAFYNQLIINTIINCDL